MSTNESSQFAPSDLERGRAIVFGRDKEKIALYSKLAERTEKQPSSSVLGKVGGAIDKLVLEPYRGMGRDIKYFSEEIASPFATKLLKGGYAEPILRTIGESKIGEAIDSLHQTSFGKVHLKPLQQKLLDFYEGKRRAPLVPISIEETKQFAAGGLNTLTGGIVNPDVGMPQTQGAKIAHTLGEVAGVTAGLHATQKGVLAIAQRPAVLGDFIKNYPTLAKYFTAVGGFSLYGQLNPELSDDLTMRLKRIAIDVPQAIGFTALNSARGIISIPASFGVGYGFAKLGGADDHEALVWGIGLSVLDAASRVGGKGVHGLRMQDAERMFREQAQEMIKKEGFEIKKRYTDAELDLIRREAAWKLHPDRPEGNLQRMQKVNWAVDVLKEVPVSQRIAQSIKRPSELQVLKEELARMFGRKVAPAEAPAERPVPKPTDLIEPPGGFPPVTTRAVEPVGGTVKLDTGEVYNLPTPKMLADTPPSDAERIINTRIMELNKMLEDTKLSSYARENLRRKRDFLIDFSERINPQIRKIIDSPEQILPAGQLRENFNEVVRTIKSGKVQTPEQLRAITHFQYTVADLKDAIRPITGRFHPRIFFDELKKHSPKLYEILSAETSHARVMNEEMALEHKEVKMFTPARERVVSPAETAEAAAKKAEVAQKKEIEKLKEAATKIIAKRTEIPIKIVKKWLDKHGIDPRTLVKAKRMNLVEAILNDKSDVEIAKEKAAAEAKDVDIKAPAREKEIDEKIGEILEEMKAAKPGKRVMVRPEGGEPYFIAEGSTFPEWVPGRLRLTDLFEKVIKDYQEGILPKSGTREAELYDLVEREAMERLGAEEIDLDKLFEEGAEEESGKEMLVREEFQGEISDNLEPLVETGQPKSGKTPFTSHEIINASVPKNLSAFAKNIEDIKNGQVSHEITDGKMIAINPKTAAEGVANTKLFLNYKNAKKIVDEHGLLPVGGLVRTANEADEIYLIKKADNKEKLNYIKIFEDGSLAVIGANKIDGYATVTFFEVVSNPIKKQNYLKSLKDKGSLVYSSGRAAVPPSIGQARVPASLSGVGRSKSSSIIEGYNRNVKGQSNVKLQLKEIGSLSVRDFKIESPNDVADMFSELKRESREKSFILNLNENNEIINVGLHSIGTLNAAMVHPREALAQSLASKAEKVYFVHNHPSGDPSPSESDIDIFHRLKKAYAGAGIELVGGVIINHTEFGLISKDAVKTISYAPAVKDGEEIPVTEMEQKILNSEAFLQERKKIKSPDEIAEFFAGTIQPKTPIITLINLNSRNQINGYELIGFSFGNIDNLKKKTAKSIARFNPVSLILATNIDLDIPSNREQMSDLKKFVDILGIDLVDTLYIRADGGFQSFAGKMAKTQEQRLEAGFAAEEKNQYERAGKTPEEYLKGLENTREAMKSAGENTKLIDERIVHLKQKIAAKAPEVPEAAAESQAAPGRPPETRMSKGLETKEEFLTKAEEFKKGEIKWEDLPPIKTKAPIPKEIQDSLPRWKDAKWALTLSRETMERNIDHVAGKDAPAVKEFLVEPTKFNDTARAQFVSSLRKELNQKIVQELGIRAGSKEDALVMRYGEGRMYDEKGGIIDLVKETPQWHEVMEAAKIFRKTYDDLLDMVNQERAEFGYEPIPRRQDYFRHFQEIGGIVDSFGVIMRQEDLPTEISGLTGVFKPGKPFSTAELRRLGIETTELAIKGMDNYLDSISRQIFHIDSVQRGRALEQVIRESSVINRDIQLPNFVANLLEWTNLVSGKKAQFDRAFESLFGRQLYGTMNWLRGRTSANMVGGNVSSALTNFIPITQLLSTTAKQAVLRGLADATLFRDHAVVGDQISDFLTRRFPEKYIDARFLEKDLKKEKEILGFLFITIDKFTSRMVVASKYYEKRWEGLGPEEAMKQADDFAAKVMADRSIGQTPNLFGIRTLGPITQFQLEINNQYSFITKDIPAEARGDYARLFSMLTQFAIYSFLFNELFEKLTGRRVAIDPIYAAMTLGGYTPEGNDEPMWRRIYFAARDIKDNMPFTGSLAGGRFPIFSGLPSVSKLLKGEADITEEIKKPVAFLVAPAGGLQAKKTFEGAAAWVKGGVYSDTGRLRYPVEQSIDTFLKLLIFGRYSVPEAKLYYNEELGPLGPAETKHYQNLLDKGLTEEAEKFYNRVIGQKKAAREVGKLRKQIVEDGVLPNEETLKEAIEKIKKVINTR